jgi:hypothetical protein
LGGIKEGGGKAINMSKISVVLQGPDESPSQFYEHLCKAFHLYTPFNLEATKNRQMISTTFVGQVQGDIRQKLQKWERFTGMNASKLLELSTKVFVNRDPEAKQEANRNMKKKAESLAAALAGQLDGPQHANPGRGRGNPCDQCPRMPAPRKKLG